MLRCGIGLTLDYRVFQTAGHDAWVATYSPGRIPARLGVQEAHEELMEGMHIQLLLEGQLILEEGSLHDAAAQEAQGACFYGLVNSPGCPLCTHSGMSGSD